MAPYKLTLHKVTCEMRVWSNSEAIDEAKKFIMELENVKSLKSIEEIIKVTICVDLAVTVYGIDFYEPALYDLTQLKPIKYKEKRNMIKELLGLNKIVTIEDVCGKLKCPQVRDLATRIHNGYISAQTPMVDDMHPQFVTMSVYVACRVKKMKTSMTDFTVESRLNKSQFLTLEEKFMNYLRISDQLDEKVDDSLERDEMEKGKRFYKKGSSATVYTRKTLEGMLLDTSDSNWRKKAPCEYCQYRT